MKLALTGDVNLMHVADPEVPFARVVGTLREADVVFSNLECCFYQPPWGHDETGEGFHAAPAASEALRRGGIHAVGLANNVNYGEAAILSSVATLDRLGIPHTGAGADDAAARAPAIVERGGVRVGFLQRTSVYWPTDHEASATRAGVAVIRGHTAYHVPVQRLRSDMPPANRPGVPPDILTWADAASLQRFRDDVAAVRGSADFVVASCHWGLKKEVLQYMTEIAHVAIDAGADVVMGHGPHDVLPIEIYRGRPIFYGLGSFSFHTGHRGIRHGDWVGMLALVETEGAALRRAAFRFVRHNAENETVLCELASERETLQEITMRSAVYGTELAPLGEGIVAIRLHG